MVLSVKAPAPDYSIIAIKYASSPDFPLSDLGITAKGVVHPAWIFWLIRGKGHTILFDTGFHRSTLARRFTVQDYLRPDQALLATGVKPQEITDVILSHAHFDHMGSIDLFPNATIWIQREEFR